MMQLEGWFGRHPAEFHRSQKRLPDERQLRQLGSPCQAGSCLLIALTYYTCLPCYVGSGLQVFSNCKDLSFLHRSVSLVRCDLTPQLHE